MLNIAVVLLYGWMKNGTEVGKQREKCCLVCMKMKLKIGVGKPVRTHPSKMDRIVIFKSPVKILKCLQLLE